MSAVPMARLLIVDDEAPQMKALHDALEGEGYSAIGFTSAGSALAALREQEFDLVLTDLMMPEMDGVAFLRAAFGIDPTLVGIVMTGHGTVESAVHAMRAGALDYINLALAGDYAKLLPLYRRGLRAVDRHARRKLGAKFMHLDAEQKDVILADFEAGEVSDFKPAAEFFKTVRYHVLEGVFCEPQYGGNKDMMGWRLVNFPGQQFGYPDPYINERVDLAPIAVDYEAAEED